MLRRVVLGWSEIGHDLRALSNLRSLKLRHMGGLTMAHFLQLLSQSPAMEDISIQAQNFLESSDSATASFSLRQLRGLKLTRMTLQQISSILLAISIPAPTEVAIRATRGRNFLSEDPEFSTLVGAVFRQDTDQAKDVRVILRIGQSLKIQTNRRKIIMDVLPNLFGFAPPQGDGNPSQYYQYLQQKIPEEMRSSVTAFEVYGQQALDPILFAADAVFPSLQEVVFELQTHEQDFNLNLLADPVPGYVRGLCPQLRRLTMIQMQMEVLPLRAVADLAEARRVPTPHGTPLESFTWKVLGNASDGATLLERIRRAVPNVVVEEMREFDRMRTFTGGLDPDVDMSDDGGVFGVWDWHG